MKQTETIILGGGLTGLTIAHNLKKKNRTCIVLEKSYRAGGVISSGEKDGFTFEKGPNTGVYSTPELVRLFDELSDGCKLVLADSNAAKRLIWKGTKWRTMPSGLFSAVSTPLFTFYDKFRILGEPFRKPGSDPDESVAKLVRRRMGDSFLAYAVDPFISGVYAGNPEKLITRFALPKLYNLEQNYGSFIGGAIKKRKEPKTDLEKRATREVFSVEGGLGKLVEALVSGIGEENIITGHEAIAVVKDGDYYIVRSGSKAIARAPSLVTSFGGDLLAEVLPFVDSSLMQKITEMDYARVVQVALGYKKWDGIKLDAFGGLVPSCEGRKVLGILFPSAIFKNRAPEGGALLSVFLGGYRSAGIIDLDDEDIKKIVMSEIREMMGTDSMPDLIEIFRYRKAIPQYELSSGDRFEAIKQIEHKNKGLFLAGNIRNGIGIADRVAQASLISTELIKKMQ